MVFISGYSEELHGSAQSLKDGSFLQKPFSREQLLKKLSFKGFFQKLSAYYKQAPVIQALSRFFSNLEEAFSKSALPANSGDLVDEGVEKRILFAAGKGGRRAPKEISWRVRQKPLRKKGFDHPKHGAYKLRQPFAGGIWSEITILLSTS